jgi:lipoate-protein ligase A
MRCFPPAVVLGGAQPAGDVDEQEAARRGYQVARRRSGGGAVLVGPEECVWIDMVVPAGDRLWDPDVSRAAWWVGDLMASALESLGLTPAGAWKQAMVRSRWTSKVCFTGLAAGEVTVAGKKVVGVSQRRTRQGALIQTATLCRWRPADLIGVLAVDDDEAARAEADLSDVACGIGSGRGEHLWDAVIDQLMP